MESPARHEETVARAFDGQAAAFERAPIQTDPRLLAGLVAGAGIPPGSLVLDGGCGPGLVAEAVLADPGGHRVLGVDLSGEMVRRAAERCARFDDRVELVQGELTGVAAAVARGERPACDAAVTRFVLHHVPDPREFVGAMVGAVRPGGVVVLADHVADADADLADWHVRVEVMRDRSHVANLSAGQLVDLAGDAGLVDVTLREIPIATDFEEWFARGTPSATHDECRALLLSPEGRRSRAWHVAPMEDGNLWISGVVAVVRGVVPG